MSIKSFLDYEILENFSSSTYLVKIKKTEELKVVKKYKILNLETIPELKILLETLQKKVGSEKYIAKYEGCFSSCDLLYVVSDYCEGGNLRELLLRATKYNDVLHESEVLQWFVQSVLAYHHIIQCGGVVREVNPKNLLLKQNDIKIAFTDLILCHSTMKEHLEELKEEEDDEDEEMMQMREYKKCYVRDGSNTDLREKDILWALGCILYETCTLKKLSTLLNHAPSGPHGASECDTDGSLIKSIDEASRSVLPDVKELFIKMMTDPQMTLNSTQQHPTFQQLLIQSSLETMSFVTHDKVKVENPTMSETREEDNVSDCSGEDFEQGITADDVEALLAMS